MEIEKKYLLKEDLKLVERFLENFTAGVLEIAQFYVMEKDVFTRYRSSNGHFYKTVKTGSGLVREEIENKVSAEEFSTANTLPKIGEVVFKTRYVFEFEDNTYELDVFLEHLDGLILMEVEFDSEEEANNHQLPEIFNEVVVKEVTEDNDYTNSNLAKRKDVEDIK